MFWVVGLMAGGVVGLLMVVVGLRGSPLLSTPRCRKCGYDLRGFADTPPTRCNECGADLSGPHAVTFGRFERRPKRVAAGGLLLLLTAATTLALREYLSGQFNLAPPLVNFKSAGNAAMLASLAKHADNSLYWDELTDRLQKQSLNPSEANAAIDGLAGFVKNNQFSPAMRGSQNFVMSADSDNVIDPAAFDRLVRAVFKPQATAAVRPTVAVGESYEYRVEYENNHQTVGDYEFVKSLTAIRVDNGTVTIEDDNAHRFAGRTVLDQFEGRLKIDAPPGPHTLTFVVDAALLYPGDAPTFGGAPGPPSQWPAPRTKWLASVQVPITVVKAGTPTVRLVTDAKFDPVKTGSLKVTEVKVTAGADGPHFDASIDLSGRPVPQAYTVTMTVDGATFDLGTASGSPERSAFDSGPRQDASLSPAATTATLCFTPAPSLPSTDDHIWGLPVEVRNVPLRRYDLKVRHRP